MVVWSKYNCQQSSFELHKNSNSICFLSLCQTPSSESRDRHAVNICWIERKRWLETGYIDFEVSERVGRFRNFQREALSLMNGPVPDWIIKQVSCEVEKDVQTARRPDGFTGTDPVKQALNSSVTGLLYCCNSLEALCSWLPARYLMRYFMVNRWISNQTLNCKWNAPRMSVLGERKGALFARTPWNTVFFFINVYSVTSVQSY